MFYLYSQKNTPLEYVDCGQLHSHETFIHVKRTLDYFVLIIVCKGTLYISQDSNLYEVHPNQFVILFPGYEHYGYLPSSPGLSYYWIHFRMEEYHLISRGQADRIKAAEFYSPVPEVPHSQNASCYLVPDTGTIYEPERTGLIIRMMMDMSQQPYFHKLSQGGYAASLLIQEIMTEDLTHSKTDSLSKSSTITRIREWILANCVSDLSVHDVADFFGYNVNYLSALFKKKTGYSLKRYIAVARCTKAKYYLLNSNDSIKAISHSVGFSDERAFMKIFKQLEGVTPSQFRGLYYKTNFSPQLK